MVSSSSCQVDSLLLPYCLSSISSQSDPIVVYLLSRHVVLLLVSALVVLNSRRNSPDISIDASSYHLIVKLLLLLSPNQLSWSDESRRLDVVGSGTEEPPEMDEHADMTKVELAEMREHQWAIHTQHKQDVL